jgi:hypothetical protein
MTKSSDKYELFTQQVILSLVGVAVANGGRSSHFHILVAKLV